jgi:hypothetical protein
MTQVQHRLTEVRRVLGGETWQVFTRLSGQAVQSYLPTTNGS